jgi:hypothetical protein
MKQNPYIWNQVHLDILYGRSKLIDELLSGLPGIPPISYAIAAGRRMGKSTVLRSVEQDVLASDKEWRKQDVVVFPIYVDGLSLSRPLKPDVLWGRLYDGICSSTPEQNNLHVPGQQLTFDDFVVKTRKFLADSPQAIRILVLFDEIEPVLAEAWADGYFANWRALLSNTPGVSSQFAAVFSGAQELVRLRQDIGSPLMDVLELRSLANLDFEESCRLMREPIQKDWSDEFCRYVFEQTGGQPMLLQYVMQSVCAARIDADPLAASRKAVATFLSHRSWQFSDWWYKHCSPTAQSVYRRLPADFSWAPLKQLVQEFGSHQANNALDLLLHVGIAVGDSEGMAFRRAGRMFADWQAQKGTSTPTASHDLLIYQRLNSLDESLAKKYSSSWGILNADIPNYSGAVSEMRDTLTLVLHRLAPDEDVMSADGFALEQGQNRPTRRQRTRFIAMKRSRSNEMAKALANDLEALEFQSTLLERSVTSAYGLASSLTHTTSTQELAFQSLKQGDSILAQLLDGSVE